MELIRIKDCYLPNCYPSEINKKKPDVLEYFIKGQGWKKTKRFRIVEGVELPDRHANLSWLQIAELFDKYGIEVANCYAQWKVAGIVSRQTARSYGYIYQAIKHLIPANFSELFFDMLACDYMMSCFGLYMFDIITFDKRCSAADPEYSSEQALYKGNKCSLNEYVRQKFGADYVKLIDKLIEKASLDPNLQIDAGPTNGDNAPEPALERQAA